MAKKKTILNPEIHQAGLDVAKQIVDNAAKPEEMAEMLRSRFHDLDDGYSIGITRFCVDFLKGNKCTR